MTLIASLSGDSRSKGLLAAGMWLMLPTIGVDPPTGVLRYGMGTLYLWDGPGPISVVIGRFAISEVIDLRPHGLPESGLLKL